jgi:lipoate-protein ligase A
MQLLDLTLPSPAENLALDEALLETAETGSGPEVLRLWESPQPIVVVGRASQVEREVNLAECQRLDITVLRRPSGGAAIVAGPGCLMYAVVLSYQQRPHLRMIDQAHCCVLETLAAGLRPLLPDVAREGISDLTIAGGMKFSGNSRGRLHADFVTNVRAAREALKNAAIHAFAANEPLADWPQALTAQLAREKYSSDEWNLKR